MTLRRPQLVTAVVFALALLASLGPHLLIAGYQVAGARPPAALLLLCPLHRLEDHGPRFQLHAKPLDAPPSS